MSSGKGPFSSWVHQFRLQPTLRIGINASLFAVKRECRMWLWVWRYSILTHTHTDTHPQQHVDAQNKRLIFDNFIDVISDRLLNSQFRRNNTEHLLTIRVKTLTALRHLDAHYKREIVLFLYDNHFIRADIPASERLDLDGADLSDVKFTRSSTYRCTLTNLYLTGVFASGIIFNGCELMNSVFDRSDLNKSQFISSSLGKSTFVDSFLDHATFIGTDLDGVNFAGAQLTHTSFLQTFIQGLLLINSDLLGSNLIDKDLTINDGKRKNNTILNSRLPNGSFSTIDSVQLVEDGGAEIEVCEEILSHLKYFVCFSVRERMAFQCETTSKTTHNGDGTKHIVIKVRKTGYI